MSLLLLFCGADVVAPPPPPPAIVEAARPAPKMDTSGWHWAPLAPTLVYSHAGECAVIISGKAIVRFVDGRLALLDREDDELLDLL